MAEQKLQFSIGSVFNGQGFNAAKKSIGDMSSSVKKAASASQQLAGAVSGMNTQASKAAAAMSGLFGVLASGNIMAIAITATMAVLNKRMNELTKAQEDAKTASANLIATLEKLKAAKEKAFDDSLAKRVDAVREKAQKLGDEFERAAKNAAELKAAVEKTSNANDNGKLLDMEIAKQKKVFNVLDDVKELVAAQEDYKIQLEKNSIALKKREAAVTAAKDALQEHYAKENNISDRIYGVRKEMEALEREKNSLSTKELEKRKKIEESQEKLRKIKEELETKMQALEEKHAALKEKIAAAEQERENQEKENQIKLNDAVQKVVDARQAHADAINKAKEEELKKLQDSAKKASDELNNAQNQVANLGADFQQALDDFRRARASFMGDNMNLINQAIGNMPRSGLINNQNLQNPIVTYRDENGNPQSGRAQDVAAKFAIEQGIKDGTIQNSKQAARAGRDAARAYRDAASSPEANQARRDANELERLRNKNPRAMSPAEKKKLEQLEQLEEGKKKAAKDAEDATEKAKEAQDKMNKAQEAVIDIQKTLEKIEAKLGLK